MDAKKAGDSLDSLVSAFNSRIAELQELVIARNMYPASSVTDLSAIDAALKILELQVQGIKDRVREETLAIPKAKVHGEGGNSPHQGREMAEFRLARKRLRLVFRKLIDASLKQKKKLQNMSVYVPSYVSERLTTQNSESYNCLQHGTSKHDTNFTPLNLDEEPVVIPKEKKGRSPPPLWFITNEELESLSAYMRGRLTLEKVNAAINDMATYAETNAHIIAAPKKKLAESNWEKSLELRAIASDSAVKGKYFFLENDIKGPALKLDNTGKAILTVLRHLGRISESRIGHHRVIILLRPQ